MITFADSEEEDLLIAGAYSRREVAFADWLGLSSWHGLALILAGSTLLLATLVVNNINTI